MKKLYLNDIILNILIIIFCISVPICLSVFAKDDEKTAVISHDGNEERRINLSEDFTYFTHGVEVTVEDGKAYVSNSSCPDRLCMKMKDAQNVGDSIICVPNKVSVRIVGKGAEKGADVVAG
ncbi:MAG: NusG domain II-containing protein [Clostridia bacterium]|nr:NusG domain II-containing protein [Clostridia bacterium]